MSGKVASSTTTERAMINQANQLIGGYFHCRVNQYYKILPHSDWQGETLHYIRTLVFLPPPTEITTERGIDLIINNLLGKELKESPPEWEKEIDLPGLINIEKELVQKEREKEKTIAYIDELIKRKKQVTMFRRLLWTKGTPLEEIVKEAFIFLGFPEIQRTRSKELEDWVFDFQTIPDYKYGVIEVKGSDKRTSLADLTQCNKWVEDFMLEGIGKAKGIFVPNQHRLLDLKESLDMREHFEPNELEYADKREICILPSHEICKAVVEKMKNNPQINRRNIEQRIASSKNLCKLI